MKLFIFSVLFLLSLNISAAEYSYEYLKNYDYSRVYKKVEDYDPPLSATKREVVEKLLSFAHNRHEQLYSIYLFLVLKIDYDYTYTRYYSDETFKHRSGVCNGYALLFVDMCKIAGFEATKINGLAKGSGYDIKKFYDDYNEKYKKTNHAWNKVKLYGKWYLFDATWASNSRTKYSIKNYWLADPAEFVYSHYPLVYVHNKYTNKPIYFDKTEDQFLEKPVSYRQFVTTDPYSHKDYYATTNNIAQKIQNKQTLSSTDFDLINLLSLWANSKQVKLAKKETSETLLKLKKYYTSGNMKNDINSLIDSAQEFWDSNEMQEVRKSGKELISSGWNKLMNSLDK